MGQIMFIESSWLDYQFGQLYQSDKLDEVAHIKLMKLIYSYKVDWIKLTRSSWLLYQIDQFHQLNHPSLAKEVELIRSSWFDPAD